MTLDFGILGYLSPIPYLSVWKDLNALWVLEARVPLT
jgi:hypothetical protein